MLLDMLLEQRPDAAVFALDTHVLFPETYDVWRAIEKRYGIKIAVYQGPSLGRQAADPRRGALGAGTRHSAARSARSPRSARRSRGLDGLDHGHPARPVADARRDAEDRLGRAPRALEGGAARRLDRRVRLGVHRAARPPRQRAAPSRATLRSAAPTARCRARAARAAGRERPRPNAGCTHDRDARPRPPLPPRRARGRGDPHHARGRGRARAARAALLRRQGLDRAAAPRREGVPPRQVPVPADARRHGPQLPRGDRVPRPPRRRARRAPRRRLRAGVDRPRPRRRADRRRARRATSCRRPRCSTRCEEHGFDAAIGGARRDEERSRAKERIFSFRDDFGQWDPRAQRPELWNLYNGKIRKGEQVRVFPISNWTELDVWQYVAREGLELPSIYYAHEREVFERDGMLYAVSEVIERVRDARRRSPSGCASAPSAT